MSTLHIFASFSKHFTQKLEVYKWIYVFTRTILFTWASWLNTFSFLFAEKGREGPKICMYLHSFTIKIWFFFPFHRGLSFNLLEIAGMSFLYADWNECCQRWLSQATNKEFYFYLPSTVFVTYDSYIVHIYNTIGS